MLYECIRCVVLCVCEQCSLYTKTLCVYCHKIIFRTCKYIFVKPVLYVIQLILSTDCVDILPFQLDVHTGACGGHATFADKVLGFLGN